MTPTGMDGEIARDDENKTVTVEANFYYSKSNLEVKPTFASTIEGIKTAMNSWKNDMAEAICQTDMKDYTVNFKLNMIDVDEIGGDAVDMAKNDPIGNSITHDPDMPFATGEANASVTSSKHLTFNAKYALLLQDMYFGSENSTFKHEFFHIFGLRDRSKNGSLGMAPYIERDLMSYDKDRNNGVAPFLRVLDYTGISKGAKKALINTNNREPLE